MEHEERLRAALGDRYQIERQIGSGGMATVYLAQDLKHHRKVAVKVLRPELAAVLGSGRFLSEIQTTAHLQHPNILPLFDSGETDGQLFYVMPYVEGESLRHRLDREKQLPVDEAVRIADEVAEALQAAHDQGVIHRDIKPANILLSRGKPLVADFGIAIALSAAGGGRLTETGLSLGSPHYMSPEQATADREPSKASDIYSLGCVLYEMLVGEPPFTGATAQAVFAKVLTEEPTRATQHRKTVPANVEAAICRALEKLPADRFPHVQDFGRALADPGFRHRTGTIEDLEARGPGPWNRLAMGLTLATAVFAVALGWMVFRPSPPQSVERYSLALPETWDLRTPFSIAPDGSTIVFRGTVEGQSQLFLRRFDDLLERPIPGTENGFYPALSPDGRDVAFISPGGPRLQAVSLEGGPVRTLADSALCCVTWGRDGFVYFSRIPDTTIVRVAVDGGAVQSVTTRREEGDGAQGFIRALPKGEGAVFTVGMAPSRIEGLNILTGERKMLAEGGANGYLLPPGYLTFASAENQLLVAPFDARALELTGAPVPVIQGIQLGRFNFPLFDISESGTLVYLSGASLESTYELVWVTRSGTLSQLDPGWTFDPDVTNRGWDLSPDGTRLAVKVRTALGTDIWVKELPDGPLSRLTSHEGEDRFPQWSSDGSRVVFLSDRAGDLDVWTKRADGIGEAELVFDHEVRLAEAFLSPGEEWLILRTGGVPNLVGGRDILAIRTEVDSVPVPLVVSEFDESGPALSPDGRLLSYQSDETGRREIFLRPFPETEGGKIQVSENGGRGAVWAHGGEELFYVAGEGPTSGNRVLMSARIRGGALPAVIERRELFTIPDGFYFGNQTATYLVSPDDQRFLMLRMVEPGDDQPPSELILVRNWFTEVEERLQGGR